MKFLQVLQGFLNIFYTTGLPPCALHPCSFHRGNIQCLDRIWSLFFLSCACKKSAWKKIHLKLSSRIAAWPCMDICPCLLNGDPWERGWGWRNPSAAVCFSIRAVSMCTSRCSPASWCARQMCCHNGFILKPGVEQIRAYSVFAGIFPASGVVAASHFGSSSFLPMEEAEPGSRQAEYCSQHFFWGSATPFLQHEGENPQNSLEKLVSRSRLSFLTQLFPLRVVFPS